MKPFAYYKSKLINWYKYTLIYKHINPIIIFNIQRFYEDLLTLFYKPRITGTWEDIKKELKKFSIDPTLHPLRYTSQGLLIRFLEVKQSRYSPYIFTKIHRGFLKFRKRNNCFMIPGDCGTYDISDQHMKIFELLEIPTDLWYIDIKAVQKKYRVKAAPKKCSEYY